MVKQTRIIFEIGDIVSIRIQCKCCKREVVQGVRDSIGMREKCPLCNESWGDVTVPRTLLKAIQDTSVQGDAMRMKIRLELDGEQLEAPHKKV